MVGKDNNYYYFGLLATIMATRSNQRETHFGT